MKLTFDHPKATRGRPVFLDDDGSVKTPGIALYIIRKEFLGMTAAKFGVLLGVSRRTVNGWEQGRRPAAVSLYMLKNKLNDRLNGLRK